MAKFPFALCSFFIGVCLQVAYGQKTCTSNPLTSSSNTNFGAITWIASGGATVTECDNMADGISPFTGNVVLDLANNTTIAITNNVSITGNLTLTGGSDSFISVSGGHTVHVTGNAGDPVNNGIQYQVVSASDHIIVDGTLYGKNNDAFIGAGTITGGTLNVKNNSTCGTPCPVAHGFASCTSSDSFCANNSVVLPIVLFSFTGVVDNDRVYLKWVTISELNFSRFIVQHSTDGLGFYDIGEVKGPGYDLTNIHIEYSFGDKNPVIGNNYYRLKAVDLDERVEYHPVIRVLYNAGKNFDVYPNPLSGTDLSYQINFNPGESDEITIVNQLGLVVKRVKISSAENQLMLADRLPAGLYFVTCISGSFKSTKSLVVH